MPGEAYVHGRGEPHGSLNGAHFPGRAGDFREILTLESGYIADSLRWEARGLVSR